jgi:dTDP-4-dehydrorhamnose 3,5-epimerase
MPIEGIKVIDLELHEDDRGSLVVIARTLSDAHPNDLIDPFGEVYLVSDPTRGIIRAFHKHQEMWDYFCIIHGSAKFVFRDDRSDSPTHQEMVTLVTSGRKPRLIVVPPGVFHGWMSLENDTQMISLASHIYNRENPDEVRIPPDSFGDVWTVKGR